MDQATESEAARIEILPCPLNDDELRERADRAARKQAELESEEEQIALLKKASKERTERLGSEVRSLLREVRTRSEDRDVQVVDRVSDEGDLMETVRTDSGEIVRSRPLTPAEKQVVLFPGREHAGA